MREITSAENERLKAFAELCKSKKERDLQGVCVIDGVKLCLDAAARGMSIKQVWIDENAGSKYSESISPLMSAADEIYLLKGKASNKLSDLKAPQGVFAVTEKPRIVSEQELAECTRILGLCSIQNPENAAAAVRTAAALGYEGVVLTGDCADIWSPRCIRAGAGAQFAVRVCETNNMAGTVKKFNTNGFATVASALTDEAMEIQTLKKTEKLMVLVGNEGHGLPEEVISACTKTVIIPMSGDVESLNANAAASILMWEFRNF